MEKKKIGISFLCLSLLFLLTPLNSSAMSLLINQKGVYFQYGYGLSNWNGMTTYLNDAFGVSNITVSGNYLDNIDSLLSYDRLWITPRKPGDKLTSTEISNIESYISTGKRVVLVGENSSWLDWNQSILQAVGGAYNSGNTLNTLTPVFGGSLTEGVKQLYTFLDGLAIGGTPLFNENVSTLWGDSQNALSILSINILDDLNGCVNTKFKENVANWLAGGEPKSAPVPEPGTMFLMGIGLIGLIRVNRKKSK